MVLTAIHDRALSLLNTLHLVLTLLSVRSFDPPSLVLPDRRIDSLPQFGTQHENVSVVTDFTEPCVLAFLVPFRINTLIGLVRACVQTNRSARLAVPHGPPVREPARPEH